MTNKINASSTSGLITSGSNSDILELQTDGVTGLSVNSDTSVTIPTNLTVNGVNFNTAISSISITTLFNLKALTIAPPITVILQGKTIPGDGGGGLFRWESNSTTTTDDGLIIQCTSGPAGRYKRLYDDWIKALWFGAKFDNTTDDTVALTRWLNAVLNTTLKGSMPAGNTLITAELPKINKSNVMIQGTGSNTGLHSSFPGVNKGTIISYVGAPGATMLTVAPDEGAGNQALTNVSLKGIAFFCVNIAAKGVVWKSVRFGDIDIAVHEATSIGLDMGCVDLLNEARDTQYNRIRYVGRNQDAANGIPLRVGSSSVPLEANVSLNNFDMVDIMHMNATGIVHVGTDNNLWSNVRVWHHPSGSASYAIEWQGGANPYLHTRAENYIKLSTTLPSIVRATGYAVPATRIRIYQLDYENGTPDTIIEPGATAEGTMLTSSPVPTSSSGALGASPTCTLRYFVDGLQVKFWAAITIPNNGTGSGVLRITLPVSVGNDIGCFCIANGYRTIDGAPVIGNIPQGSNVLSMTLYNGTYPVASGNTILINGFFERAKLP